MLAAENDHVTAVMLYHKRKLNSTIGILRMVRASPQRGLINLTLCDAAATGKGVASEWRLHEFGHKSHSNRFWVYDGILALDRGIQKSVTGRFEGPTCTMHSQPKIGEERD